jgi:hypothetical protein
MEFGNEDSLHGYSISKNALEHFPIKLSH